MSQDFSPLRPIIVHYFTDCGDPHDANGRSRLQHDLSQYFFAAGFVPNVYVNWVPNEHVGGHCAVDILGRRQFIQTVILVNAATRKDEDRGKPGWENGPPFAYYWIGKTLLISTLGGDALSLLKKTLNGDLVVHRTDIEELATWLFPDDPEAQGIVIETQFRSLEYVIPLAAKLANEPGSHPPVSHLYTDIPTIDLQITCIDGFGNIKLSCTKKNLIDRGFDLNRPLRIRVTNEQGSCEFTACFFDGGLTSFPSLTEWPQVTIGSSGIGNNRTTQKRLELMIKNGSAAAQLGAAPGDLVLITQP